MARGRRNRSKSIGSLPSRTATDVQPRNPLQARRRSASFSIARDITELSLLRPDDIDQLSTNQLARYTPDAITALEQPRFDRIVVRAPSSLLWQIVNLLNAEETREQSIIKRENIRTQLAVRENRVISPDEVALRFRVFNYLKTKTTIKIGFEEGINFGNLAAGLALIKSVKELGFSGRVTIVGSEGTIDKLRQLDPEATATFTIDRQPEFDTEREYPSDNLDDADTLHFMTNSDMIDSDSSFQLLNYLRANQVLVMSPYGWQRISEGTVRRMIQRVDGGFDIAAHLPLEQDRDALYRYAITPPDNFETFLEEELPGIANATLRQNLSTLKRRIERGEIEFMPSYGMHRLSRGELMSAEANIIAGIKRATLTKPTVLLNLSRSRSDLAPNYTADNLQRSVLAADDLSEIIGALPTDRNHVLVIDAQSVPNAVFTEIYRMATLPAILEGASTLNLVQLIGTPFISIASPSNAALPFKQSETYQEAINELNQGNESIRTLANISLNARDLPVYKNLEELETTLALLGRIKSYIDFGGDPSLIEDLKQLSGRLDSDYLPAGIELPAGFNINTERLIIRGETAQLIDLGMAYIRDSGVNLDAIETRLTLSFNQLKQDVRADLADKTVEPNDGAVEHLAQIIRNTRAEDNTALKRYFSHVFSSAQEPERDQVLSLLDLVTAV